MFCPESMYEILTIFIHPCLAAGSIPGVACGVAPTELPSTAPGCCVGQQVRPKCATAFLADQLLLWEDGTWECSGSGTFTDGKGSGKQVGHGTGDLEGQVLHWSLTDDVYSSGWILDPQGE